MKKATLVALLILFAVLVVAVPVTVRTVAWWHRETAAGHHLAIGPFPAWGFYGGYRKTSMCYPPPEPDYNTVYECHQYGPISDVSEHKEKDNG